MPTPIPHFALPFRFERGRAAVCNQDSVEEITNCVTAIVLCPRGFRFELQAFGIDDPTFIQGYPDLEDIAVAIADWEPRAQTLLSSDRSSLDELVTRITVSVGNTPAPKE